MSATLNNTSIGYQKGTRAEHGEDGFPGFALKAMSHADIIIFCCAFTEI
jgi:hypothetical protein